MRQNAAQGVKNTGLPAGFPIAKLGSGLSAGTILKKLVEIVAVFYKFG